MKPVFKYIWKKKKTYLERCSYSEITQCSLCGVNLFYTVTESLNDTERILDSIFFSVLSLTHTCANEERGERIIKLQINFGFQHLQCFAALFFRYIHSYQSYLWNHAASLRVQKYGMLSLVFSVEKFHGSFYASTASIM